MYMYPWLSATLSKFHIFSLIRSFEAMANLDEDLEHDPTSTDAPVPSAAAICETPSGTGLTLMPSTPNMTMEQVFFSLQQLQSRISTMEAEQTMMTHKVLTPSTPNMTMEQVFFSLQQLQSRISTMEAEQTRMTDKVLTPEIRIPEMITREEIDSRFAQLRNQMSMLQLAQQALHSQFQEVAKCFHQVSEQWKEQEAVITSMRSLVDKRPSNQRESESFDLRASDPPSAPVAAHFPTG